MSPILKKILFSLLILLIYFFVWRTIRGAILEYGVKPFLIEFIEPNAVKEITIVENNSLSYFIHLNHKKDGLKEYIIKVPGGIFFLLGCLTLLFFVGADAVIFTNYVSIQFIVLVINFVFLFFGLYVHYSGIYMMDLIGQYVEPVVNLGFVLFFIQEKRKNDLKLAKEI
ncbi:MAG: hypothetical protein GW823_01095 [Bacteroidetes bacterium]|nr:hypothetical protein [Bacteroidota bacterium]